MPSSSTNTSSDAPSSSGPIRSPGWLRRVATGAGLLLIWIFLSGKLDAFHLSAGVMAAALAVWLDSRLPLLESAEKFKRLRPWRWVIYFVWLLGQMLVSAVYVAKVLLWRRDLLNPRLVRFRCVQPDLIATTTLANSITLTPGTLTISVEDDCYLVHALSEGTTQDLLSGKMQARVARIFVDGPAPEVVELPVEEGTTP